MDRHFPGVLPAESRAGGPVGAAAPACHEGPISPLVDLPPASGRLEVGGRVGHQKSSRRAGSKRRPVRRSRVGCGGDFSGASGASGDSGGLALPSIWATTRPLLGNRSVVPSSDPARRWSERGRRGSPLSGEAKDRARDLHHQGGVESSDPGWSDRLVQGNVNLASFDGWPLWSTSARAARPDLRSDRRWCPIRTTRCRTASPCCPKATSGKRISPPQQDLGSLENCLGGGAGGTR